LRETITGVLPQTRAPAMPRYRVLTTACLYILPAVNESCVKGIAQVGGIRDQPANKIQEEMAGQ
jgi:hypothetical protein